MIPVTLPRGLVCLPGAGADASAFQQWGVQMGSVIELVLPSLPGRRRRWDEEALESVEELADEVIGQLEDGRYSEIAFFGFSLGALVAYEAVVRLGERMTVTHLFVAGSRPPNRPKMELGLRDLSDRDFRTAVSAFSSESATVFADDDLSSLLLPTMRSDFIAAETYSAEPRAGFSVPITALWASEDPVIDESESACWAPFTSSRFSMAALVGDHNFPFDAAEDVVDIVQKGWQ